MAAGQDIPIVDTHQHLWDLDKFHLPWTKDVRPLARNFLMKDYLEATAGLEMEQTVYMEVDVEPSEHEAEARAVLALCQSEDNPMSAAVIGGRPASPDFEKYLSKFKGNPFMKGVRQVLHVAATPARYCLSQEFVRGVQRLGDFGMSFDLCMRAGELLDADKLVAQCPGTRFILDHCGNRSVKRADRDGESVWKTGMQHLADHDNVVCKVSGIVASADSDWKVEDLAPTVLTTIEIFGADRVMFGGDWPVCTLRASFRQWVEALREITTGLGPATQGKLFHDNAVRFYHLADKAKSARR